MTTKNRALLQILGTKMDKISGGCRILNNEHLHKLYPSPDITRVMGVK
jgi:hypothetical protein